MLRILVTLLLCLGMLPVLPVTAARPGHPNVVLFLIDDLGWADLGITGSTFYETPRVDQLAREGAFFSDAYAASPVCSPTRASIQSGKYPSRIGMSYLAGVRGPMGPDYPLIPPPVVGNVPHDDVALPEALREAGYVTAHIGKWHLQAHGEKGEANYPDKHGFDINIAGHTAGQPGSYFYPYRSEQHSWSNVPHMEPGQDGDYLTDALTDKAIGFIEAQAGRPFFLNLCYYTVHTPIQARPDKLKKYQQKARRLGLDKTAGEAVPELNGFFSHQHQDNPAYAAMVESMDENIGRILDALTRLDLDQDTIVIFYSDNGGLSTGKGPRMPTSNLPLRAGKAWIYEGGIRVPAIIKYPAAVKPGLKLNEPIVSTDLYPTILDLAGLPLRPEQHVDGVSLKPLLTGGKTSLDREAIYFHLPHYHHINSMGPAGAVRAGDYKLVEVFETGAVELYNLRDDPGEQHDLAKTKPKLAAKLKNMLATWREDSGSLMTTRNPDYKGKVETGFYTPQQDQKGLAAQGAIRAGRPNVLLLGDSISIGYTPGTVELLKDIANVQRPKANCGDTRRGLENLDRWLGDTKWDVIHFNWGLHDLCYRHPDAKAYGNRDKVNGTQSVPLEQYEKNLAQLVGRLQQTGATLVWASTTVVPEGEAGRVVGDDVKYNAAAAAIMNKHGIAINDLHALTVTFPRRLFRARGDVHYTPQGSTQLAEQVAAAIRAALPAER